MKPRYWRSLEELAETPEFREKIEREFPRAASEWDDPGSRRRFLKLMAASLSLAGITGCTRQPTELIMPYVHPPENLVYGKPLFYATAVTVSGAAQGVLVESHEGHPTKVEGNPDHPASLGATDVLSQAYILSLYDPDRLRSVSTPSGYATWSGFRNGIAALIAKHTADGGARVRLLTRTIVSPTLASQIQDLQSQLPNLKWTQYEAAGPHSARAAAQAAFGRPVNTWYRLDRAKTIVALDSDFLACGPTGTRYAHDFALGRRVRGSQTAMNRLYSIESTLTSTGGKADHRWTVRASQVESAAEGLAAALGLGGAASGEAVVPQQALAGIAADLRREPGTGVVIPGETATPRVHVIAHAINAAIGAPVVHTAPIDVQGTDQLSGLRTLIGEMNAGAVDVLVIIGGNPVYDAPVDLDFAGALSRVRDRIILADRPNETTLLCNWIVPESHGFETWGDARAFDGTTTILQPLILPLYDSYSAHDLIAALTGNAASTYEIVRQYWSTQQKGGAFGDWWRKSVHDGLIANSALPEVPVPATVAIPPRTANNGAGGGIEISFRPDPYILDGRLANNAWLQELPRPMTKMTWDNPAYVSVRTAEKYSLSSKDVIEIDYGGKKVRVPVWITPGQPDDSITLHLGFGHSHGGTVETHAGVNVGPLRYANSPWMTAGASIRKTGEAHELATTQLHHNMEGRDIVVSNSIDVYRKNPDFVHGRVEEVPKGLTLYPEWDYRGVAWGMVIDQTACVNCMACVIACQAENNIPVVGKEQVLAQRYMHWLRVDTYFEGPPESPSSHYQPVPCMQCENAPCEVVCPTQATNHSSDGLNDMVYNRCVGTRYCSNNCPYKVRRFNFLLYADWQTDSLKFQRNPDVTVRSRGVMEKCTYCVQRIREAEITARKEDRYIRDGEVVPACAQACPTQAIVFGDLNNKANHVAQLKREKLNYSLLAELNTRPRTTYLAELRNPNPEVAS